MAEQVLTKGEFIYNYADVSSNQSSVTTTLAYGGTESKIYHNTGSSTITISFATSGLIFIDGNDSMEISPGEYGEVNYLAVYDSSNNRKVFVRSIAS